MKKNFLLILLFTLTVTACGRKGPLEYPEGQKKPKFEKISDEMTRSAK